MVRVRLTPGARRDHRSVRAYYRSKSPSAAERFQTQLEAALRYISEYPEGAEAESPRHRGKVILDFPYSVLYEIRSGEVIVVAIASHYQRVETE